MKIRKEVKIGFVMILAITLLFWGANFLKGNDIFSSNRYYYAIYEHVDRLSSSNPVTVNGFKVGKVESVGFMPGNTAKLVVRFSITVDELEVPIDTKAEIVNLDILGSKGIDLKLGKSAELAPNSDTLDSDIEATLSDVVNQEIAPIKKKAEDLLKTVDSAIVIISSIFNEDARASLDNSFTSISSSLATFNKTMLRIDGIVEQEEEHIKATIYNIQSITRNLAQNNETLNNSLENIEAITDSLAAANLKQTIQNAAMAIQQLANIVERVNQGEGSLGMLLTNDTLYNNIESSAQDLDKLLIDMRLNPERYVHFSIFGRKSKAKREE